MRMRKDDPIFEDLCNERDKIVGIMFHHEVVKESLEYELERWDNKIGKIFAKAIKKEIKQNG